MARKTRNQRLEDQRVRQKRLRDGDRKASKPSRDHVARMALWRWISNTWRHDQDARRTLDGMRDDLTDLLVSQGFKTQACGDEIERLFAEYNTDQPPFRIKRHLKANQPPDELG